MELQLVGSWMLHILTPLLPPIETKQLVLLREATAKEKKIWSFSQPPFHTSGYWVIGCISYMLTDFHKRSREMDREQGHGVPFLIQRLSIAVQWRNAWILCHFENSFFKFM